MPKPSAADRSASSRLSVSNCQMTRRRDAPMASRMPISRWRPTPRANSRLATFAHPISRMRPNAKKSGVNGSSVSADSGIVPVLGSSTRLAGGRSTARSSRTPCVPRAKLRERLLARQTGPQPTDDPKAAGAPHRPRAVRRNSSRRESGAQNSGAIHASPRKPSGITPTTWNDAPFTRMVRSSTPGSLAKCRDQVRWLRTMTGGRPGSSSDG
jgi:hypothetical protein